MDIRVQFGLLRILAYLRHCFVSIFILGCFSSTAYHNYQVSLFQRRLDMERLFPTGTYSDGYIFCTEIFYCSTKKNGCWEISCRMKKSKKPDIDELQMIETWERSCEKKEKGWRVAFLCVMVGIAFRLVFSISFFGA